MPRITRTERKFATLNSDDSKPLNHMTGYQEFLSKSSRCGAYSPEIPHLPVLDALLEKVFSSRADMPFIRTGVVYVHHALYSSLSVLCSMFELGLDPKKTFVLNKSYSECPDVVKKTQMLGVHHQACSSQVGVGDFSQSFIRDISKLWGKVLCHLGDVDNLIIMDHGGHAVSLIPPQILEKYNVVGVEKTTAGFMNPKKGELPFPVIDVATCAAKKFLESPVISEALVNKLAPLLPVDGNRLTYGVVGYGSIGKALVRKLKLMGRRVVVYDEDQNKNDGVSGVVFTNELSSIISFSDVIFGCTGQDISKNIDSFRVCTKDKVLISCSSEDQEFLSLLKLAQQQKGILIKDPFDDLEYSTDLGASVKILKGGFPVNFDRSGESVPMKDIQLTRGLILCGALQAAQFFRNQKILNKSGRYMLDAGLQRAVVDEWIRFTSGTNFLKELINNFRNETWVIANSGGICIKDKVGSVGYISQAILENASIMD